MIHISQKMVNAVRARFDRPRDRGAALVEAAIAIPILLLVILGSIEFGFAWDARSSSASSVRSGVLRAASIGDKPETDMRIIQSIVGQVGPENVDRIEWIVLFERQAGVDPSATIASCRAGTFTDCVNYDDTFIQSLASSTAPQAFQLANFDTGGNVVAGPPPSYACTLGNPDTNWCAGRRTFDGDIELGVAMRYNHEWITGIFPFDAPAFQDYSMSSTFIAEGASINSSTPIPSSTGTVLNTAFNTGVGINTVGSPGNPGTTWTGATDSDLNEAPNDASKDVLGPFGDAHTVSLTVDNLEAHSQVCVSFTLYIIGSWDKGTTHGPDSFALDIGSDGTREHDEVYSQNNGNNGPEVEDLGYEFGWSTSVSSNTQKVDIVKCSPHTGDSVTIDFIGNLLEGHGVTNEAWALDDVKVTVV